ncbi:AMP-binding protein [Nocardioides sp. AE5]|uniref:AMP-binding protein n=1 Tax=Nocardioides sp. AE5 TaxID=2962573 RepID=UPI002881F1A0|nr:AMP-binding protein [Nocardioides sp. AE5]MDT0202617.1 AMP-binding protein [Nocardioides sp. AE5]
MRRAVTEIIASGPEAQTDPPPALLRGGTRDLTLRRVAPKGSPVEAVVVMTSQDATEPIAQRVQSWLDTYAAPDADAAWLLCDRHPRESVALTFVADDLSATALTYGELADRSARLANTLRARGVGRGDRVGVLLDKQPGLPVAILALWRLGAVHVPLFTAFARGAIETRTQKSGARILITEESQRSKAEGIANLEILDLADLERTAQDAEPFTERIAVGGDGQLIEIFTSGTTGSPKGVPVPLRILAAIESYLRFSLDLHEDDVYFNAADPGWAYGLYFGLLGPLATGCGALMTTGGFTPTGAAEVMRRFSVTNFAGAPTMYRAMRSSDISPPLHLRRASSAGEPLNPDLIQFGVEALGCEIRDQYGQTELAMVAGNHWHPDVARPVAPSSMGQALPGFTLGIVDGQLAVNVAQSPLMWFTGYADDPERSAERFTPDRQWYLTSDLAQVDAQGNYSFSSRNDDVILAAGYRIGPTDVESVIVTHPAVAEVAVVGRPDPTGVRGEQVEAFVVLESGHEPGPALEAELAELVRTTYSKHAYPRRVHFVEALPKTPSGKVQRFLLRENDPS